jgi:hypothetical protein
MPKIMRMIRRVLLVGAVFVSGTAAAAGPWMTVGGSPGTMNPWVPPTAVVRVDANNNPTGIIDVLPGHTGTHDAGFRAQRRHEDSGARGHLRH